MQNGKRNLLILVAILSMMIWSLAAQEAAQGAPEPSQQVQVGTPAAPGPQAQRPGNRRALGDKDGDGICDVTGEPVGKRAQGGPGTGQGRGMRFRQDSAAATAAGSGPSWRKQGRRGGCKGVCDRTGRGSQGRGRRNSGQ